MSTSNIEPEGVYAAREVCRMIPSHRGGHLHLATFHRWRLAGKLRAFRIGAGWYCHGAEVLRLLQADQADSVPEADQASRPGEIWQGRSAAARRRGLEQAEAELRQLGLLPE